MFSLFKQPMSDTNEEQIQEQIASLLTVVLVLVIPTIQKILHTLQEGPDNHIIHPFCQEKHGSRSYSMAIRNEFKQSLEYIYMCFWL